MKKAVVVNNDNLMILINNAETTHQDVPTLPIIVHLMRAGLLEYSPFNTWFKNPFLL